MSALSIDKVYPKDFPEIVDVWETSVRATHHFLAEEHIRFYKPLILNEYLNLVDLVCIRGTNREILGFMGTAGNKIEMLFIHPDVRKQGIGKKLLSYAINTLRVNEVDVNEQNAQAVGFYQYVGFTIVGRSDVDSMGKPFPILHMQLAGK